MSPDLHHVMQEATRLTRAGDLTAATAAIQAALRGQPMAAPAAAAPQASSASRRPDDADVIDVEVREVDAAKDAGASTASRPQASPDRAQPTSATARDVPPAREPTRDAAASTPAGRMPGIDLGSLSASFAGKLGAFTLPDLGAMGTPRGMPRADSHDPRFLSGTFELAGNARDYKLYVPASSGDTPLPLVVMLHGCTQNPDDFAAGTRMNAAAEAQGFYVLYPEQSTRMNPQRCWNWFKHSHQARGRGEPALLAGMTRDVMARYAIDPDRVYVAGLSAGGAMAAILGDTYPELYAAVGVHSGLATGTATDLPSALSAMRGAGTGPVGKASGVPTIVFHGDADATVHPTNGEQVIAASVGGTGAGPGETVRSEAGLSSTRHVYRDGDRVVAEHWLVHGAPHAWSGGSPQGSYTESRGPDATAEMLRFFFERSHGSTPP